MNRVIEILCCRDGISVKEAAARVKSVQEQLADVNYDYDEVEDIMANELGLEMNFVMDLI